MDVGAYLRRIGYDGPREPSATTLADLHRQHLLTVPFENLDIHLGTPIRLAPTALYDKIVIRRRGGFCYELNGLFADLLTAMGFRVQMLSAQVRQEDGGLSPEFDHMLLKVDLREPWLVDVGFGDSFVEPIVLCGGGATQVNGCRYSVLPVGDVWQLSRNDGSEQAVLYQFRDVSRNLTDYYDRCSFHQTSPDSHFQKSWVCSRATATGRVTISGMRLIVTGNGKRQETQLNGESELRQSLHEQMDIDFDETVPISKLVTRVPSSTP